MNPEQSLVDLVFFATIFAGLATLIASIPAFRRLVWDSRLGKKKISVFVGKENPKCIVPIKLLSSGEVHTQEFWFRLGVQNRSSVDAKRLLVQIEKIFDYRIGKDYFVPSWWFKASNLDSITADVPSGATRYFDLAFFTNPILGEGEMRLLLCTMKPDHGRLDYGEKDRIKAQPDNHYLPKAPHVRLEVTLSGDNIVSQVLGVELAIAGSIYRNETPLVEVGTDEFLSATLFKLTTEKPSELSRQKTIQAAERFDHPHKG